MTQKKKETTGSSEQETEEVQPKDVKNEELDAQVEETLDAIDDVLSDDEILSDIDDILEENAEEFVSSFIQKGGE